MVGVSFSTLAGPTTFMKPSAASGMDPGLLPYRET
jgi:hypothetical protein